MEKKLNGVTRTEVARGVKIIFQNPLILVYLGNRAQILIALSMYFFRALHAN